MVLISLPSLPWAPFSRNPISLLLRPSLVSHIQFRSAPRLRAAFVGARTDGEGVEGLISGTEAEVCFPNDGGVDLREGASADVKGLDGGEGSDRVRWEREIIEATAPLIGLVRTILHSEKYQCGDRLTTEHESVIRERLLPYHPRYEMKIGCGIEYITLGHHPDFEKTRCLFIVGKNGEMVDFSYWKCIKGLIRKNYPRYAESFILKHFGWRSRSR